MEKSDKIGFEITLYFLKYILYVIVLKNDISSLPQ